MKIAGYLEDHPLVAWIRYPGLKSHPQHELAGRQMKGYGSMISFGLKGGFEAGRKLMDHVRLATLAVSLGGVESLVQHPASMTHSTYTPEELEISGISGSLLRISVGLEDAEDIITDLDRALEAAKRTLSGRSSEGHPVS